MSGDTPLHHDKRCAWSCSILVYFLNTLDRFAFQTTFWNSHFLLSRVNVFSCARECQSPKHICLNCTLSGTWKDLETKTFLVLVVVCIQHHKMEKLVTNQIAGPEEADFAMAAGSDAKLLEFTKVETFCLSISQLLPGMRQPRRVILLQFQWNNFFRIFSEHFFLLPGETARCAGAKLGRREGLQGPQRPSQRVVTQDQLAKYQKIYAI